MKVFINNAVRRAIWHGLDREFVKWDGYPRNPYGDSCIREDCNRLYWQDKAWAFMRKHTYRGEKDLMVIRLYGFKWSDVF